MATNIINKSSSCNQHHHHQQSGHISIQHPHRSSEPTDNCGDHNESHQQHHNYYHHQNHQHNHQSYDSCSNSSISSTSSSNSNSSSNSSTTTTTTSSSGRLRRGYVSASLPIQVPVRQMKKDLNRAMLSLFKEEQDTSSSQVATNDDENNKLETPAVREAEETFAWDDDDSFLEQEYNENHHKHYPINEYDLDNLTAEDDPMRLFASIQALARSLHEDDELFGSLPPKRMLESPIRTIAFV